MIRENAHYREAEKALERAAMAKSESNEQFHLGVAQVHATLALAPASKPEPAAPESRNPHESGLQALVDMLNTNQRLHEITRFTFNHINVPLNSVSGDPRETLQAMVTGALAYGATVKLHDAGKFVGVLLSWGNGVSVHVYDRPHRLGDVASLLPSTAGGH